jgi:parvulin-like peptidyl-prolyl isomerase
LVAALNALKSGEVSGLVEINGYGYIIRKDEQKDARVLTFEEAHSLIESRLKMRQSEKLYKEWIARLRSEAYIKIFELPTK